MVDGLFGGGAKETIIQILHAAVQQRLENSIFVSRNKIALESVCFDFLRTEWNGLTKHDKETMILKTVNMNGLTTTFARRLNRPTQPESCMILITAENHYPVGSTNIGTIEDNNTTQSVLQRIELVLPDTLVKTEPSSKKKTD